MAEQVMSLVSTIQSGNDKCFHVQMLVRVTVYSGISISLATHTQKHVASKKPMKNSRVKMLCTGASYWKNLCTFRLNIILDAIVLGQAPNNLLTSTLLYTQIVCGTSTTVNIQSYNLI